MNGDLLHCITQNQIKHLDSRYNCCYCEYLLRDACQTKCGCFVCDECRIKLFSSSSTGDQMVKCPGNTEECLSLTLDSIRVDHAKRRDVLASSVRCPFSDGKCTHMIKVSKLLQHFSECEFAQTRCPFCQQNMPKESLAAHQQSECPEGKATCPHCGVSLLRRELTDIHLNKRGPQCPKFTFNCDFCQQGPFTSLTIGRHSEVCENWMSTCSFMKVGCEYTSRRAEMPNHEQEACANHIELMMKYYLAHKKKILQLKPMITNLKEQSKNTVFEEKYIKLVELVESLGTADSSNTVAVSSTQAQQQETINLIKEILDSINERQWPKGYFVWKVDNFSQKRAEALESSTTYIESPSFYSPQIPSYLLRLRINVIQVGSEPSLSIGFHFLPGEYDDILDWPFTGRITIEIVNPRNRNLNKKEYIRSEHTSPCFQRPTSSTDVQLASIPQFISLQDLESNYLVRDTIWIACQVVDIR